MQLLLKPQKNTRTNVFRIKKTTKEVPLNIFRGFEVRKKV